MPDVYADRVLETSTTTGTGAYTLAGGVAGFITFGNAPSMVDGSTCPYYAEDVDAYGNTLGGYEIGTGTWNTGGTLTRTSIQASSNGGAAVSWAAGTRRIGLSLTAAAFAAKQATLVSGTNIKTLNSESILGGGNVVIKGELSTTPVKTSAYTALVRELVRVDSALGSFTVTLPVAAVDGDKVGLTDTTDSCATFPVLLAVSGGATIEGDATGLSVNIAGAYLELMFNGTNWKILETPTIVSAVTSPTYISYSKSGALTVAAGTARQYPPHNLTLSAWEIWTGTAPTGASLVVAVKKNGTIVETLTLGAGSNYATGAATAALLATDYLTVDVTQVGSTVAGSDLSIRLTGN